MPFDGNMTEQRVNLERLARMLERSDSFDITELAHDCGTPACIHGHANVLLCRRGVFWIFSEDMAKELGLPKDGYYKLCFDWTICGGLDSDQITGRMAAAALRRLADTGEARFDLADA